MFSPVIKKRLSRFWRQHTRFMSIRFGDIPAVCKDVQNGEIYETAEDDAAFFFLREPGKFFFHSFLLLVPYDARAALA